MKNPLSLFQKKKLNHTVQPGYVSYASSIGNDAFTDWTLIIIITCIVAGSLIGVGGYVYVQTQAELGGTGTILPASSEAAHFDAAKLKSIISTFDGRTSERVMLQKGYVAPKDPSLP